MSNLEKTTQSTGGPSRYHNTQSLQLVRDLWSAILPYWDKVLLLCILTTGVIVAHHFIFPKYKSQAAFMIKGNETGPLQDLTSQLAGNLILKDSSSKIERYYLYLKSFSFYLKASKELEKRNINITTILERSLLDKFQENSAAEALAEEVKFNKDINDIIQVTVHANSIKGALDLANAIVEIAMETIIESEVRELDQAKAYLLDQTRKAQIEVNKLEMEQAKLAKLTYSNKVPKEYENKLIELEAKLQEDQILLSQYNDLINSYKKQLTNLLSQRDPSVEQIQTGFSSELNNKISTLEEETRSLQLRIPILKEKLEIEKNRVKQAYDPLNEINSARLQAKIEAYYNTLERLQTQVFEADIRQISAQNAVIEMESARLSTIKPDIYLEVKIPFGIFSCIIICILATFLVMMFNPKVRSHSDIAELGIIQLGGLPLVNRKKIWLRDYLIPRSRLDTSDQVNDNSALSMALQKVRVRLSHTYANLNKDSAFLVAVQSTNQADGKTFVARNLATSLGQMRKKVLLIDADLRQSALTSASAPRTTPGLTELLKGDIQITDAITSHPNLKTDLITSGEWNHQLQLEFSIEKLRELIDPVKNNYDYIIFDTPPLNIISDAEVVAAYCDINILVLRQMKTSISNVQKAVESIKNFNKGPILGLINQIRDYQEHSYGTYLTTKAKVTRDLQNTHDQHKKAG